MTNSKVLRIIGQELENREVFEFKISRDGDTFSASGKRKAPPPEEPEPTPFWKRLFQASEKPGAKAPDVESVQLQFTLEELERMDRSAGAQRPAARKLPDDYSTSNILRVVGAFVDQMEGTLVGLTKQGGGVVIEYEKPGVGVQVEERTISSFYDFSTRLQKWRQD